MNGIQGPLALGGSRAKPWPCLAFNPRERAILLAVRGVGPGVVARLEQLGIHRLETLARQGAAAICADVAAMLGSTCWRNQPKARDAIAGAIAAARSAPPG